MAIAAVLSIMAWIFTAQAVSNHDNFWHEVKERLIKSDVVIAIATALWASQ